MKKLFLVLAALIFSSCSSWGHLERDIDSFQSELGSSLNSQEEADVLESIWLYAHEDPNISMYVQVVDAEGNKMVNNLPEAVDPLLVQITLAKSPVAAGIEFRPIDRENIYILLNE